MAVDLEYYGVPPADYREQENRTRLTATAGQTTFSAPYSVGYVDVYYNGAKLDPFTEFTATDGANVVLTSAAFATGDIVEVISRAQVQVANVYTQQQVNALLVPYFAVATGTGDAQVAVTNPTFTSYVDGMIIKVRTAGQNTTTTPVINCNAIGNKNIVSNNAGAALYSKDWVSGSEITLRYNQTLDKLILVDGATTILTPPQFDNSNQIPTTAFVQRALGNYQGIVSVSAATTLTASQSGAVIECGGSSTYTITLPTPATQNLTYTFICNASVPLTLSTPSGLIYYMGAAATSQSLMNATACTLISDGASWIVVHGNGAALFATNGYQRLPSGLTIQWGTWTSSGTSSPNINVTYPLAFSSATYTTSLTVGGGSLGNFIAQTISTTAAGFTGNAQSNGAVATGIGGSYIAIGK
jgi:hypothetical protein